jgi:hypothetical protein
MAFEHYDSGRSHLFPEAEFGGAFETVDNRVTIRASAPDYPTPYNVVYLGPDDVFVYGGGYGDVPAVPAHSSPRSIRPRSGPYG